MQNRKRTPEEFKQDLKGAAIKLFLGLLIYFIVLFFIAAMLTDCHMAGMTIEIDDDVPGDHAQIENETIHGVEFFGQHREIKEVEYFQSGLKIYIKTSLPDQLVNGQMIAVNGLYEFPGDKLSILWYSGVHTNALFHELLHHERYRYGKKSLEHGSINGTDKWNYFYGLVSEVLEAYCVDQGMQVNEWYSSHGTRHVDCTDVSLADKYPCLGGVDVCPEKLSTVGLEQIMMNCGHEE